MRVGIIGHGSHALMLALRAQVSPCIQLVDLTQEKAEEDRRKLSIMAAADLFDIKDKDFRAKVETMSSKGRSNKSDKKEG